MLEKKLDELNRVELLLEILQFIQTFLVKGIVHQPAVIRVD